MRLPVVSRDFTSIDTARSVVSVAEREALERAETLCSEAQELVHNWRERISHAEETLNEQISLQLSDARAEKERILKGARDKAATLLQQAIEAVDHNVRQSELALEEKVAQLASAQSARAEAEEELQAAREAREEALKLLEDARRSMALDDDDWGAPEVDVRDLPVPTRFNSYIG